MGGGGAKGEGGEDGERARPQCYTLFLLKGEIDSSEGIFQH